jgi:hypothetical protein
MLSLSRPQHSALDTFNRCSNGVQDRDLKTRLTSDQASVADADMRYEQAGAAHVIHGLISTQFQMAAVSTAEMTWLYNNRLVAKTSAARPLYNALKQMAGGRCALCGVRDATTLDHHLPKSRFPSLAVNPLNLVPSCNECNRLKSSRVGGVHAYFDDLSKGVWLVANLVESPPCVVRFQAVCPDDWPAELADRVRDQFAMLQLGAYYSGQAGRRLRGEEGTFRRAFESDGPSAVRINIEESAASWRTYDPNSWEAAMYTAMAQSDWFCNGGFEINGNT